MQIPLMKPNFYINYIRVKWPRVRVTSSRVMVIYLGIRVTIPMVSTAAVLWNKTEVLNVIYHQIPTGLWKVS